MFHIYAISKDDGNYSDPDSAIDKYYYWCFSEGEYCESWDHRQTMVNRLKSGFLACTFRDGEDGARCEVKRSPDGVEYLKTIPNGDPTDNLSNLPEIK